ncbi:MAG: MFS transporter [Nitrolancea sp.]
MTLRKPFYGWAIVAMGMLITFSSGPGQSYVFSVFLDSIIQDTGLSRTTVSALYAVGTGVSAALVLLVSRLADRYGPRLTVAAVALALGSACFGMSFATGFVAFFLAFAALRALGQGSLPINATLLTASWFVRRRGRAMAVVGLGFALSNAVLPGAARFLIEQTGWRHAYMFLGVMVWVLVIPGALLLVRDTPEQVGLFPDGADSPPDNEPRRSAGRSSTDSRPVLTSPLFWLLAVPLSTPSFVSTALVFHQVSIFSERGLDATVAAAVFVPYAIASASFSALAGFAIDRFGPKRLFSVNMLFLLGGVVMVGFIGSTVAAVIYALILGSAGGIQRIISGVTWAHIYGRHGLGRVQGSAMMVSITSAAIGPLPLAYLHGLTGSYTVGLAAMAVLPVLAVVMISFARPEEAIELRTVQETAG